MTTITYSDQNNVSTADQVTQLPDSDPYEQLVNIWLKSSRSQRRDTKIAYAKCLMDFASSVGHKPLDSISRKDVVSFRDQLLKQGNSAVTANSKIGILRMFFRGGQDYELISNNPAADIHYKVVHERKSRVAFSVDDLSNIFHCGIYTKKYRPVSGGKEAAYWLPLLALYTGARVEELAQLLVSDIKEIDGLGHIINISDDAPHAHLKNANSRRRVPVHGVLIACGFLDYVAKQAQSGMLFPDLKPNHRGKYGGYFSYFFSTYLRKKIGITDERKVFHSFRHTFKDCCRQVGIEEAVHDALTGHSKPSASRGYGNEQYPLDPLFEAIARYDVADLDLSHLYVRPVSNRLLRSEVRPVSAFYGLVIAFSATKNKRLKDAFVLVLFDGRDAGIAIQTKQLLYGYLPDDKLLLATAWISIHQEELLANWQTGRTTGEYFKIDPLR